MSAVVDAHNPGARHLRFEGRDSRIYTPARLRAPRSFEFTVPATLRFSAGLFDYVLLLCATIYAGQTWNLAIISQIFIFIGLRFFFEVILVALCGRTPGRFLLKLYVSESSLWPSKPRLRSTFTRHLVKSGDLLFGLIIGLTAAVASIGSPSSIETFTGLVLLIPLTIAAHVGFFATPVVLFGSLLHGDYDRPFHDRVAKTFVFATVRRFGEKPVKFF